MDREKLWIEHYVFSECCKKPIMGKTKDGVTKFYCSKCKEAVEHRAEA